MSDKHFVKSFEIAKIRKAHPDYIRLMHALSLIDGSHKKYLKAMRDYGKFFREIQSLPEAEKLKIVVGKSWIAGFEFAFNNLEKLKQAEKQAVEKKWLSDAKEIMEKTGATTVLLKANPKDARFTENFLDTTL